MNAEERSDWITKIATYIRIIADNIDNVVINMGDGSVITFHKKDVKDIIGESMFKEE